MTFSGRVWSWPRLWPSWQSNFRTAELKQDMMVSRISNYLHVSETQIAIYILFKIHDVFCVMCSYYVIVFAYRVYVDIMTKYYVGLHIISNKLHYSIQNVTKSIRRCKLWSQKIEKKHFLLNRCECKTIIIFCYEISIWNIVFCNQFQSILLYLYTLIIGLIVFESHSSSDKLCWTNM